MNYDPVDELIESAMAMSEDEMLEEEDAYDEEEDDYDDNNEYQKQHSQFLLKSERKALDLRCSIELAAHIDELEYKICVLSAKLEHTSAQLSELMKEGQAQVKKRSSNLDREVSKLEKADTQEKSTDDVTSDDIPSDGEIPKLEKADNQKMNTDGVAFDDVDFDDVPF